MTFTLVEAYMKLTNSVLYKFFKIKLHTSSIYNMLFFLKRTSSLQKNSECVKQL